MERRGNLGHPLSRSHGPGPSRECRGVFQPRSATPLIATLVPCVYANRFRSPTRTIYTLYNATGRSLALPLVGIARPTGQHLVELLSGEEVQCVATPGGPAARLFLRRQGVACVACLPERLRVQRSGEDLEVRVVSPQPGLRLVICDKDGKLLGERPVEWELITLRKREFPATTMPASVRLLQGERLVDLRTWENVP